MDFWKDFKSDVIKRNLINSIFLSGWNLGFIVGCSLTITSHADIMYSSSSVFLFVFSIFTCQKIFAMEVIGYSLYVVGVYFMFTDPNAVKTGQDEQAYLGDLIAFGGAGCCAIFNIINNKHSEGLPPIVMMGQTFFMCSIYQLLVFPFLTSSTVFYSFDPEMGAFGWLTNWNAFILVIGINAPITGLLSNLGFYTAYFYFPMQVIAGTMLIEPFFAQLVGVLLGQDEIPGIKTLIGCLIITVSFLIIARYGAEQRDNSEERHKLIMKLRSPDDSLF